MGKKNLIILLLIPFLIALLGVMTINGTFSFIENDIVSIRWDYNETEGFKIGETLHPLKATALNLKKYPAGSGNDLVWSLANKDGSEEEYAQIIKDEKSNNYYLKAIKEGIVIITCSNEKGNISKKMTGILYENGAVIVNPKIKSSQNNVDQKIYYGEYDLVNGDKTKMAIDLDIKIIPSSIKPLVKILNQSDSVEIDLENQKIKMVDDLVLTNNLDIEIEIGCEDKKVASSTTFNFTLVKDGINVYSYSDLLYCTNNSKSGEIAVLRKSFESVDNAYIKDTTTLVDNNIECFGNYNKRTNSFTFSDEVYRFETTYNDEYIDQWNNFASKNKNYKSISNEVLAGLHIQKDFYGNGYTINFHNLAYPSGKTESTEKNDKGENIIIPTLTSTDLFRGPLPFYTLGDPNNLPLVTAYGQDNVGMYVDGDNIIINDVDVRNCDFGNILTNLDTVGNVVDVYGDNITIKNSRFKNGKNIIRCFSSDNFTLDNSMLEYSRNFLLYLGTNEYVKIEEETLKDFINLSGEVTNSSIKDYLGYKATGDNILNTYLTGTDEIEKMYNAITSIQKALNDEGIVKNSYKGTITINDTLFSKSGISSISIDTLFNGPYLYSCSPSMIGDMFKKLDDVAGSLIGGGSIIPLEPVNVSGLSYPIEVNLTGKTKFYDYKTVDTLDLSGLIGENISKIANEAGLYDGTITIDDIFPLKELLFKKAPGYGQTYQEGGKHYMNIALAYYGGGLNLSKVSTTDLDCKAELGTALEIDLLDSYLNMKMGTGTVQMVKGIMLKCVTVVTGFEPFKFICFNGNGYLFNETPKVKDLQENAKGE